MEEEEEEEGEEEGTFCVYVLTKTTSTQWSCPAACPGRVHRDNCTTQHAIGRTAGLAHLRQFIVVTQCVKP